MGIPIFGCYEDFIYKVFVCFCFVDVFISLGIPGLYDNSYVSIFKDHQTTSKSGCNILYAHKQCLRVPISQHSH